jgi:hypothetical protein
LIELISVGVLMAEQIVTEFWKNSH